MSSSTVKNWLNCTLLLICILCICMCVVDCMQLIRNTNSDSDDDPCHTCLRTDLKNRIYTIYRSKLMLKCDDLCSSKELLPFESEACHTYCNLVGLPELIKLIYKSEIITTLDWCVTLKQCVPVNSSCTEGRLEDCVQIKQPEFILNYNTQSLITFSLEVYKPIGISQITTFLGYDGLNAMSYKYYPHGIGVGNYNVTMKTYTPMHKVLDLKVLLTQFMYGGPKEEAQKNVAAYNRIGL